MEDVFRWSSELVWKWDRGTFVTLDGSYVPLAVKLNIEATNNMLEYEDCITKLKALHKLGAKKAEVFGDSTLVIVQA